MSFHRCRAPGRLVAPCIGLSAWAVWLLVVLAPGSAPGDTLTVLHTNELRGRLRPTDYYDEVRGGMARIVQLLREQERAGRTLVLDAGDALGPDPVARMDRGRFCSALMDSAGYAAMVPGNHELDLGRDTLLARAATAGFAILAANVYDANTGEPLLAPHRRVRRGDLRVLLVGAVSPGLAAKTNPLRTSGMRLGPAAEGLRAALASVPADSVDVTVALVHMPLEEAVQLALDFPEVDLFVAGGFEQSRVKGGSTHLVQLASGTCIVSTPGHGAAVGRVDVAVERDTSGVVQVGDCRAQLLPLLPEQAEAPQIARLVERQLELFAAAGADVVAAPAETVRDSRQLVAELLRRAVGAEIGLINQGALRPVELRDTVRVAHIDTLVRFDDFIVRVKLTGDQLKGLVQSSQARTHAAQQLVFARYDPASHTIDGVPVGAGETYTVAMTGYLASGGDAYLGPAIYARSTAYPELTLRKIVTVYLRTRSRPVSWLAARRGAYRRWTVASRLTGSLAFTAVNQRAQQYGGVSSMSGRNALAWTVANHSQVTRAAAASILTGDLKTSYGRVRQDGSSQEAADRVNADLVYTRRQPQPSPFLGLSLSTVFTPSPSDQRPLSLRNSAGLALKLGGTSKVRFGLGVEHDFAADQTQAGLEIAPESRLSLPGGNALASSGKVFVGATATRRISAESFNNLSIALHGNLRVGVDANFFLHWDDQVNGLGLKSELQVGLTYALSGSLAR